MLNNSLQTRREFLRQSIFFLAGSATAPFFLTRTALALDNPAVKLTDDHILVVIQMGGGNDGLNTIVPHGLDEYYRARPTLGIANDKVLKLNDAVGFHPNLTMLRDLHDDARMAGVLGVGSPY